MESKTAELVKVAAVAAGNSVLTDVVKLLLLPINLALVPVCLVAVVCGKLSAREFGWRLWNSLPCVS